MPSHTAIVTGAGSGIGRATCFELARRGWSLALVGRTGEALDATGSHLATPWASFPADLADPAAINPLIASILRWSPRIDALINNAAIAPCLPIESHTPELVSRVFAVNTLAVANLIAALWPTFIRQHGARIINISSIAALDPFPGFLAYAASKAAVNLMAASAAAEGRAHAIKAFAIGPGAVETDLLRSIFSTDALPPDRVLAPDAVAQVIAACACGERDDQNGRTMYIPSP